MKTVFPLISTFIVLAPVLTGLLKFKHLTSVEKQILFFLILGFLIDVSYLYVDIHYRKWVINIYSLIEGVFFFRVLYLISSDKMVKQICNVLMLIIPVLWLLQLVFFTDELHNLALYELFYRMVAAILCGFSILVMIEQTPDAFRSSLFWMVAAIFLYCTCTFFIVAFINSTIVKRIWYLHNIVSILSSLVFFQAFLCVKQKKKQLQETI